MGLLVALLVLALVFGAIGAFVAAAKWAFIIAVLLVLAAVANGFLRRRGVGT